MRRAACARCAVRDADVPVRTVDCHGSAHKPQYLARAVGSLGTARRLNIVLLNSCQAKPGQIRLQYANKILYEKEVLTAVS